jgi:Flp pilus assembly protein CpaB
VYRIRFFMRRFPFVYWVAAFSLAALTGVVVFRLVGRAEAAAAHYGSVRAVPVAVRAVPAGELVRPGDVDMRDVPAAFVPSGRLLPGAVAGRTALVPIAAGEVVLASKLAPEGEQGVAALLPAGAKALAVPVGPGTPPLARGNRVDVLASFEVADAPPGTDPTFPVAVAAVVLKVVPDKAVTIAVTPDEAPRVAFAIAKATVTLALTHA